MGCDFSGDSGSIPNSVLVRNLSEQCKQLLAGAIEQNESLNMAMLMDEIQAYPNSEISEPNMGWMMTHLCCRWDAHACLRYLLRYYFMENPKGYMNLVNSQTAEGYTCLHLCCVWKSVRCFRVLMDFGGLNLSLVDDKMKTALENAIEYKCPEQQAELGRLREQSVLITSINLQKLLEGPLIKMIQDMGQHQKASTENLNTIILLNLANQNLVVDNQKSLQQQILLQRKTFIEDSLEKLLQARLAKQLEFDIKRQLIALTFDYVEVDRQCYEEKQKQRLHKQLQEEDEAYNDRITQQENQLRLTNEQLKKSEREKMEEVKGKILAKLQADIANLHRSLVTRLKQNQNCLDSLKPKGITVANSFRQSLRSRSSKSVDIPIWSEQHIVIGKLKQCPQQIRQKYEQAKAVGFFEDKQFPANRSSLGDSKNVNFSLQNVVWLRPRQIFKSEFKLFDGIDPNDIKQGSLGVCYMLATVSALASNPENIYKIFIFADLAIGFYVLRLYVNGVPKYFVVDDQIPCCKTTKSPLFTKPIGREVWVLLLEKSWAKLIGSYLSAESMTPDHMMQDLSGAPGYGWWLNKETVKTPTEKIKQIVRHIEMGHVVVVTTCSDKKIQGIVPNHTYTLLKIYEHNNRYIFKVRNPWGRFQWNGEYAENSSLCNEEFKERVGFSSKSDGTFYISQNQFLRAFTFYSISHVKSNFQYTYLNFESRKYQNKYFTFTVLKPGEVNIRITQPFDRMVKESDYKYSPMVFQIGKVLQDGRVEYISQGHQKSYFGSKSVHAFEQIFQHLDCGIYFARVRMLWVEDTKYNKAVLSCYASHQVQIKQIEEQEGQRLLKQLLYSFSSSASLHRASNGIYRIAIMKGQFIFVAETQQQGQFRVSFKFIRQKMVRTETDIGKVSENELQAYVNKDKYGLVTALRTEPNLSGTTGTVSITFTKI